MDKFLRYIKKLSEAVKLNSRRDNACWTVLCVTLKKKHMWKNLRVNHMGKGCLINKLWNYIFCTVISCKNESSYIGHDLVLLKSVGE